LNRAGCAILLLLGWEAACRSAPPPTASSPPAVHVRPGATEGDGTLERPFGRLDQALATKEAQIRLHAGRHPAPSIPIARSLRLEGEPGARIIGRLAVSGATVTMTKVWLTSGLELRTGQASVRTSTLGADGEDDALNAYRARVELEDVRIRPGPRAGVFVLGSTLSLGRSTIDGATRRGLMAEASRVRLEDVGFDGASHAHGVCLACRGELRAVRSSTSARVGLVLQKSRLEIRSGDLRGQRHALLATDSQVRLRSARRGGARVFALGANGSTLSLDQTQIDAWGGGLSLATGSEVAIRSSTVAFAGGDGLTMSGGELRLVEVRFRGGASSRDGIVLHGPQTRAEIRSTRIEGPSGWAIVVTEDAALKVDSSTIGPSGGGVWVQDGFQGRSRVSRSRIRGCFDEAGLRFDGAWVRTSSVSFDGCAAVGSRRGELHGRGGRFGGGVQLFGGSRAEFEKSWIGGRPWAAFCSPGSELVPQQTQVEGPEAGCRLPPASPSSSNPSP